MTLVQKIEKLLEPEYIPQSSRLKLRQLFELFYIALEIKGESSLKLKELEKVLHLPVHANQFLPEKWRKEVRETINSFKDLPRLSECTKKYRERKARKREEMEKEREKMRESFSHLPAHVETYLYDNNVSYCHMGDVLVVDEKHEEAVSNLLQYYEITVEGAVFWKN